ncbi:MAG: VWA domain-containing protein [Lentisphaeria bacterium]|nr:MAG: VWA domain-containing protein [Lentisphaeria bacterium]
MLDWGAPHLLWILPAVWLAALVLHLYFRRRRMVVRFSDLEFFLRDEHHPAMRRRLRDLLKLLVRFLILTLPVLAVAQPRLRGIAPPGSGAVRRAIVLDDSFSMERKLPAGESAFQEAQRTALALLDGFDDGGETALFFTSARPGVLPTADRDKVRRAIREAKTASHAGTLSGSACRSGPDGAGRRGVSPLRLPEEHSGQLERSKGSACLRPAAAGARGQSFGGNRRILRTAPTGGCTSATPGNGGQPFEPAGGEPGGVSAQLASGRRAAAEPLAGRKSGRGLRIHTAAGRLFRKCCGRR